MKRNKTLMCSIRMFVLFAEASIRACLWASNTLFVSGQEQYLSAIFLNYLRLYPLYRQE